MSDTEYERMLAELNQLFNDPQIPVEPARVWEMLAELTHHDERAMA